ncbi:MAG: hypothetical protein IKD28_05200 [Clostridia bacterium]|nr:hypothetical protein [Clostridia bacterium]
MIRTYKTVESVCGPLLRARELYGVRCGEVGEVLLPNGESRPCRVLEIEGGAALVEVLGGTDGICPADARVRFCGRGFELPVSVNMLGRVLDGMGRPMDGGCPIPADKTLLIDGSPCNPLTRLAPLGAIEIDGTPLTRGSVLPMFVKNPIGHAKLAVELAARASAENAPDGLAIVVAAVGLPFAEAESVLTSLRKSGTIDRAVLFINLDTDPVAERTQTPLLATSTAEYLAFDCGMQVLLVIDDLINYADALRERSAARGERGGKDGYPTDLYSHLAALFARAGLRRGSDGSLSLLPVLTLPEISPTHPVCELVRTFSDTPLPPALWQTAPEAVAAACEETPDTTPAEEAPVGEEVAEETPVCEEASADDEAPEEAPVYEETTAELPDDEATVENPAEAALPEEATDAE